MSASGVDDIDRDILRALQEDARNNTNAAISETVNVSARTVAKRIARLEEEGIIFGYRLQVDYEKIGFPMRVLFVCTAPIGRQEDLVERTLDVAGVVTVRDLMTGSENVHVEVIGLSMGDVTRVARVLDEIGYTVVDEILVRNEYERPSIGVDAAVDGD